MNLGNLVGETLDGKYRIERELGKGGMGAVYLATHIGTERPVAVKVIVPQFMQKTEFVERFKREARAAGRLRHPNVVDVTDFGFDETQAGRVAYLVMEYLDGCTLGEILEEEKRLPLDWSLDILEQVCSAVQEAHEQGIIHRDLKPDNIWLEPDQRGGYTVKVLDFGIAKLEEDHHAPEPLLEAANAARRAVPTNAEPGAPLTVAEEKPPTVNARVNQSTMISEAGTALFSAEAGTLLQPAADFSEQGTALLETAPSRGDEQSTAILPAADGTGGESASVSKPPISRGFAAIAAPENTSSELTRVGAVLGTPLYMSPEQCRGERLDARSDIYSLAVIAYQMLSGKTPFEGDYRQVMEAHKNLPPPALDAKKVPSRLKKVLYEALNKNPYSRPPTAQAFAGILRAHADGAQTLTGRAMVIYSENLPKFILLGIIVYFPMFVLFVAQTVVALLEESETIAPIPVLRGFVTFLFSLSGFFCGTVLTGIVTWLIAQKMAVPLRPLRLRPAFTAVGRRIKPLFGTAAFTSMATLAGFTCLLVPGLLMWIYWSLVTPVVMMEGLKGREALRRSSQLVKRSILTTTGIMTLSLVSILVITIFASLLSKGMIGNFIQPTPAVERKNASDSDDDGVSINIGPNGGMRVRPKINADEAPEERRRKRLQGTIRESAYAAVQIPTSLMVGLFFSIVLALLYIKTRMAGGESLVDLLEQFEESDRPPTNWQRRIRDRLIQSGRVTSKT